MSAEGKGLLIKGEGDGKMVESWRTVWFEFVLAQDFCSNDNVPRDYSFDPDSEVSS